MTWGCVVFQIQGSCVAQIFGGLPPKPQHHMLVPGNVRHFKGHQTWLDTQK